MRLAASQAIGLGGVNINDLIPQGTKKPKASVSKKLKEFCGYTTAHGFGRIVDSAYFLRKAFWVLACLGAFSMFTYQVVLLMGEFMRKPVQTNIFMEHVKVCVLLRTWKVDSV